PSLYEGFGIPILEAFDRNLPVITSNVSSMPEVGGDAAFYINDPYNADELAAQLRKTLTLSEAEKAEVLNRMRRQLAKFSWEKNAEEIMKMFQCICKGQTESKRKLR
ncbi:MAG: glycosyltransferase, partial [Oscillospiraceae bacterium]|nr:glycosyltransferase [Oscillospiraceae bacterium]